jgi:hypothetical protein
MNDASHDNADRLAADALQLAISLDSFTTLDWVERVRPAVQQGSRRLAGLQRRRESLTIPCYRDAVVDWMLEVIGTRLVSLQLLLERHELSLPASSEPRARPAASSQSVL